MPIVADIPLIGDLFRYDSVAEERRELLIILTPQIIYTKMDSDLAKQIESSRMSWILSDVTNIHGEAGLRSRCDEWSEGEMESIYPSVVPAEGLLPLSPHSGGVDCQPGVCMPGADQTMPAMPAGTTPGGTMPPVINGEPLPTPSARLSPSTTRPTNERYSAMEAAESVQPANFSQAPAQQTAAATR